MSNLVSLAAVRRQRAELAVWAEDVTAAAGLLRDAAARLGAPALAVEMEAVRASAVSVRRRIERSTVRAARQDGPPRAA